ncbi:MAG: cyclopropane fatty acyl phospholipid synthase [Deltaproteobacteria bacterium]|nr:cyclopropane fatty acyl phospholipid synthase [Deltaproteobacteria bacterium]
MEEQNISPAKNSDLSEQRKIRPSFFPKTEDWLARQLAKAGVYLNSSNPWDPQIHNPRFYRRALREGSLGIGESYIDGWWDCEQLDEMLARILRAQVDKHIINNWALLRLWLKTKLFNLQSVRRACQVGKKHYDIGNDLFQTMLDSTMSYSCGYWHNTRDLYEAQLAKLDLVCRKLALKAGESVLDIGCGWGSFAEYAARHHGVRVTGVTISREQKKLAEQRCAELPVDIAMMDYRSLKGKFDKLVSIGMFEHVGPKNYDIYMRTAHRLMQDDGQFLLHTISNEVSQVGTDPWIQKYIFPNGNLPSLTQLSKACEPYFIIEDVQNIGLDYDRTLMAWHHNFDQAWPRLKQNYDHRFYRMWSYYLKTCAGAFRSRTLQVYQLVLRKRLAPLQRYHGPR